MHRLTWFIHNADRQCLDQPVQVASRFPIKLARIEKWTRGEGPGCQKRRCRWRLTGDLNRLSTHGNDSLCGVGELKAGAAKAIADPRRVFVFDLARD